MIPIIIVLGKIHLLKDEDSLINQMCYFIVGHLKTEYHKAKQQLNS